MTTQVVFRIEKNLKNRAMKKAHKDGLPLTAVLKLATQAYVSGDLCIELVRQPRLNAKTRRELVKISKEIRQGKNLSPVFESAKGAIDYLKSLR